MSGDTTIDAAKTAAPVPPPRRLPRRRGSRRLGDTGVERGSYSWLITFTDVMGLILTFFVLIFSMVDPHEEQWSEVTSSLQEELNVSYGPRLFQGAEDAVNVDRINFSQALDIRYLEVLMESVIEENESLKSAQLIPQDTYLILSLPQELLFEPGSATMKEGGAKVLYTLGAAFSRMRNRIEILGHADNRPVEGTGEQFDSNWDLSLARALEVASILENVGYQKPITVLGQGSGRYQDLDAITDENERQSLSRRVDILILDHGGRQKVVSDATLP